MGGGVDVDVDLEVGTMGMTGLEAAASYFYLSHCSGSWSGLQSTGVFSVLLQLAHLG